MTLQLMDWEECSRKYLRQVRVDNDKINSVVAVARKRFDFVKGLAATNDSVSFVFEGYYEVIKELLLAIMLKRGLRSSNHQCLFSFFSREYPSYMREVHIIQQMSFLRNRLDYYGEAVELGYYKENYKSFERIIELLLGLLK